MDDAAYLFNTECSAGRRHVFLAASRSRSHLAPTKKDADRLSIPLTALKDLLEADGQMRSRWIEVDRVANCFNRAVMFPSALLHSATRHFGSNCQNGRLYQSFHFSIRS